MTRIYVWELPVRLSHWFMFLCLIVLAFTGAYMHWPFLTPPSGMQSMLGTMRSIHIAAGFLTLVWFLFRSYWSLVGNTFASWRTFFPFFTPERRKGAVEMIRYYLFLRRFPPHALGHNALAGSAYSWIWILYGIEIITGFVLLDNVLHTSSVLHFFVGWIPVLIDIQWLRAIHFLGMFAFAAFAIHHVYSGVLVAMEERNGTIESIFSGYKFVPEAEILAAEKVEQAEEARS
jgi:Ni/Fe-hydrogenase 1 B-type cytochrome subunit